MSALQREMTPEELVAALEATQETGISRSVLDLYPRLILERAEKRGFDAGAAATPPARAVSLDVERLARALDLCGIGLAEGGRPASEWADALAREYAAADSESEAEMYCGACGKRGHFAGDRKHSCTGPDERPASMFAAPDSEQQRGGPPG